MCVKVFYRFWIAKIALRGVTCFTGIHFSLGSFMSYTLKVLDRTNRRETYKDLGYGSYECHIWNSLIFLIDLDILFVQF